MIRWAIVRWALSYAALCSCSAWAANDLSPLLSLGFEQRYDDGLESELGARAGVPFLSKISPQGGIELSGPLTSGEIWYAPDFTFRLGGGGRSVDHRGAFSLERTLTARAVLELDVRAFRV